MKYSILTLMASCITKLHILGAKIPTIHNENKKKQKKQQQKQRRKYLHRYQKLNCNAFFYIFSSSQN